MFCGGLRGGEGVGDCAGYFWVMVLIVSQFSERYS